MRTRRWMLSLAGAALFLVPVQPSMTVIGTVPTLVLKDAVPTVSADDNENKQKDRVKNDTRDSDTDDDDDDGDAVAAAMIKQVTSPAGTFHPVPTTQVIERLNGFAWNDGKGQATRKECQGYAEAINGLAEQAEKELVSGQTMTPSGPTAQGIYDAGKARGCTFIPE
jgi:hypothetical protein